MATVYTMSRDDVINAAFRVMGVYDTTNPPTTDDITNAAQAFNLLAKSWSIKGLKLWIVNQITIPLVLNKTTYSIGPTGDFVTDRPYRIIVGHTRASEGVPPQDQPLIPLSRQEYDMLSLKASTGRCTQFYYDPTIATAGPATSNGVLYVYPTPDTYTAAYCTLQLWVHQGISDMNNGTDVPYFPSEWYEALKYGLAKALAPEYAVPAAKTQQIFSMAQEAITELENWGSNEEAGTFFQPDFRGYRG